MLCLLVLLLVACGREVQQIPTWVPSTPAPVDTLAPVETAVPSAGLPSPSPAATVVKLVDQTATASPTTTPTPSVTPTRAPVCTSWQDLDAAFVADVEVPDDTRLPPEIPFRKTWRLRNTGACAWPEGLQLTCVAGDPLLGPQSALASYLEPGGEMDVSVDLFAPAKPGRYESFWRLREPEGHLIGAVVFVNIVVDPQATYETGPIAVATEDPTATLPATETPSPMPPAPTATRLAPVTRTPRPPATVTRTPTAQPTPTASPTIAPPTLTLTPAAGDANVCREIDLRFAPVVELAHASTLDVACAQGLVREEPGHVQAYWPGTQIPGTQVPGTDQAASGNANRSLMILAQISDQIYVLGSRGPDSPVTTVASYENAWLPTMAERAPTCEILIPPAGAAFPTKALGATWCAESLWLTIGWPTAAPVQASLALQETREGLLIEAVTGNTVYLVAIDYDQARAVIYEAP